MDLTTKIELIQIWLAVLTVAVVVITCFALHSLDNLRTKHQMDKRLLQTQMENLQKAVDHLTKCNGSNYEQIERLKIRTSLLEAALVQAALSDEPEPEPKKVLITVTDTDGDNVYERHVPADYADEVIAMMDDATDLIGAEPDIEPEATSTNALAVASALVHSKGGKDANKVQEG